MTVGDSVAPLRQGRSGGTGRRDFLKKAFALTAAGIFAPTKTVFDMGRRRWDTTMPTSWIEALTLACDRMEEQGHEPIEIGLPYEARRAYIKECLSFKRSTVPAFEMPESPFRRVQFLGLPVNVRTYDGMGYSFPIVRGEGRTGLIIERPFIAKKS